MPEGIKQKVEGNNNVQVNGNLTVNVGKNETLITERLLKIIYFILAISIICTSLPHQGINLITSLIAALLFIFVCTLTWDLRRSGSTTSFKKQNKTILALVFISTTTGCAGPMLAHVPDPTLIDLTKDYRAGVDQGIGVFGFGLEEINIKSAAKKGGIEEVYFADQIRGYGLISYRKVSVFGE